MKIPINNIRFAPCSSIFFPVYSRPIKAPIIKTLETSPAVLVETRYVMIA